MKKIILSILATALLGMNSVAYGAVGDLININFGSYYTGAAAVGQSGDYWNSFASSSLTKYSATSLELLNANHDAAGTLTEWQFNGYTLIDTTKDSFNGYAGDGLMEGYDLVNTGSENQGSITISNLEAGTYNIYVYSQSENETTTPSMTININGTNYTTPETPNTNNSFVSGANYYVYTVTIADDDNLAMTFSNNSTTPSSKAAINGLQIEAVPEPGSIALIGVGGIFVLGLRRLKSKEESPVNA